MCANVLFKAGVGNNICVFQSPYSNSGRVNLYVLHINVKCVNILFEICFVESIMLPFFSDVLWCFLIILSDRRAPSICISYSGKSDMHEIIMNPPDGWRTYCLIIYRCQHQILKQKIHSVLM